MVRTFLLRESRSIVFRFRRFVEEHAVGWRGLPKLPAPARLDFVFWLTAPNPYISQRLAELQRRGCIRFEVVYTTALDEGRSWEIPSDLLIYPMWQAHSIKIRGRTIGVAPIVRLGLKRPRIVFSFHGLAEVVSSFAVHLLPGVKLFYYVEKTFDITVRRTKPKELAKKILFRLADGFLTPGCDADEVVKKYAGQNAMIFRLDMVIDVDHFRGAIQLRKDRQSRARRAELGLEGTVFLNIGRLSFDKGIPTLLDAYARLQNRGGNCSLLLVGDGADKEHYKRHVIDHHLHRVVFLDFVQQQQLPEVYALGDVFVFPSRADTWGLVVDEAMAAGMPVISSLNVGEIRSRVVPGRTGELVPAEDAEALAKAMERLSRNPENICQLGEAAALQASWRSIDHWCVQMETLAYESRGRR